MLKSFTIRNFKGIREVRVELGGFSPVAGGLGSGKTAVFDGLCYLSMMAKGAGTAVGKFGWVGEHAAAEFSMSIDTPNFGEVAYSLRIRRNGLLAWVEHEEISQGNVAWLRREGQHVALSDGAAFDVAGGMLALSSVVVNPFGSPILDVRTCLQDIWLLSPHPDEMVSEIDNAIADLDTACRYLPQYIVARQRQQPAMYGLLLAYLRDLGSDISAFSIRANMLNAQYLVVHRANPSFPPQGLPFACLSDGEKILVLVAFLRAVNEHIGAVCCVWDNPLRDLGEREGSAVLAMLRTSFSRSGDLLLLSPENAVIRQVADAPRRGIENDTPTLH